MNQGTRRAVGWMGFCGVLLLVLLVPFFLWGVDLELAARGFLGTRRPDWQVALVLGGLLASDIALPVPSSLAATAAGALLGFWRGTLTCWAGMTVGSVLGYLLGARAGGAALRRMVGESEVARFARLAGRHGPWFLVALRAVPVLAEASVVFAGVSRMPWRGFLTASLLANLGISATYAAVGASAARAGSFLLFFAGMVLLPAAALWLVRSATARREHAEGNQTRS